MILIGIQIIGLFVGIFLLYFGYITYKRNELDTNEFVFWSMLWLILIAVSAYPKVIDLGVKILDIQRPLDVIIILTALLLFGIIFMLFISTKKTSYKINLLEEKINDGSNQNVFHERRRQA